MNTETRESRAQKAKKVFDFMAGWVPPALGREPALFTKNALLKGSPGLVSILKERISPEEREALSEWQAYRESIKELPGVKEPPMENIYDVLFILQELYVDNVSTFYRGHYDSSWLLRASYYRNLPAALKPRVEMETKRMFQDLALDELRADELEARVEQLKNLYPSLELGDLNPLQQEAAVQHYLSGTKLLDFTFSMYVAAFFATRSSSGSSSATSGLGAVYTLGKREAEEGSLAAIRAVELPDRFARIHRQAKWGLFADKFRRRIRASDAVVAMALSPDGGGHSVRERASRHHDCLLA